MTNITNLILGRSAGYYFSFENGFASALDVFFFFFWPKNLGLFNNHHMSN